MKGITPVIATIILLLITVALAGVAYSFFLGVLTPQISKTIYIPDGGQFCSQGTIQVYVANTGYQSDLIVPDDFILGTVDDIDILHKGSSTLECGDSSTPPTGACGFDLATNPNVIPPGTTKRVINWDCSPTLNRGDPGFVGCTSGYHRVDFGTVSGIQHLSIYCP